ncbi:hypothetical protein Tco_1240965 [Tanacetum coccineum]
MAAKPARHSDVASSLGSPPYHAFSPLTKSRPSRQFYNEGNGQRKFLLAVMHVIKPLGDTDGPDGSSPVDQRAVDENEAGGLSG